MEVADSAAHVRLGREARPRAVRSVDPDVAQVAVEEDDPDRGVGEERVEQSARLALTGKRALERVPRPAQLGDVGEDRGAAADVTGADGLSAGGAKGVAG